MPAKPCVFAVVNCFSQVRSIRVFRAGQTLNGIWLGTVKPRQGCDLLASDAMRARSIKLSTPVLYMIRAL